MGISRRDYVVRLGGGIALGGHPGASEVEVLCLEKVHERLGYRLSLDHLATETLEVKKSADGLQALRWWKQGKIREIIDYCKIDVKITKDLFLFGKTNGFLLFKNKAGSRVRVPVAF